MEIHKRTLYKNKTQIEQQLNLWNISNFSIKHDLSVDVEGNVDISCRNLYHIPINFNVVTGTFFCSHNNLLSLEGSPKEVRSLYCLKNQLESLKGLSPILSFLDCQHNKITSLKECPLSIQVLYCGNNKLTSIDLDPKIKSILKLIVNNNQITTFKDLKIEIKSLINFENNPIPIHELIDLYENKFEKLCNIPADSLNIFLNEVKKEQTILEIL